MYEQLSSISYSESGIDFNIFKRFVSHYAPIWLRDSTALVKVFYALDTNHDDLLYFRDLVNGLSILSKEGTLREKSKMFFRLFASKKKLHITYQQLQEMFTSLGTVYNVSLEDLNMITRLTYLFHHKTRMHLIDPRAVFCTFVTSGSLFFVTRCEDYSPWRQSL